jgi:predicted enzyme related to lactoylglutathione lyase
MTTDPKAALDFYTRLVGWTTSAIDMGPMGTYTMLHVGGRGVGGLVPFEASHGIPSHWISYITVADVDEACRAVPEAGGRVCVPPTDIPNVGRFAVIEDGQGAVVSPFKGNQPMPEFEDAPPGSFVWDELMTDDVERARAFYARIFGWTYEDHDMGPMGIYTLVKRGDKQGGGMMKRPPGAPAAWMTYIGVEDVDAAAARVPELGGRVHVGPANIPNVGKFSIVADPSGAVVALFKRPAA